MQPMAELMMGQEDAYAYHGYAAPTTFRTSCNRHVLQVSVVLCDHAIPTISYCFSEVKKKLKAEFKDTPGQDIAELRKSGTEVTEERVTPVFAFICDTSIQILSDYPEILTFPVVFIECTFLLPDEQPNAAATRHIHWLDLRPFVLDNPDVLFVLIHFSLRYRDEQILAFFRQEQLVHELPNIKVWAGDTSV